MWCAFGATHPGGFQQTNHHYRALSLSLFVVFFLTFTPCNLPVPLDSFETKKDDVCPVFFFRPTILRFVLLKCEPLSFLILRCCRAHPRAVPRCGGEMVLNIDYMAINKYLAALRWIAVRVFVGAVFIILIFHLFNIFERFNIKNGLRVTPCIHATQRDVRTPTDQPSRGRKTKNAPNHTYHAHTHTHSQTPHQENIWHQKSSSNTFAAINSRVQRVCREWCVCIIKRIQPPTASYAQRCMMFVCVICVCGWVYTCRVLVWRRCCVMIQGNNVRWAEYDSIFFLWSTFTPP